jgi:CheY-like chemotaxis protein
MMTDIGMPNMSGWQLEERIKGKYPGMKVALVTVWVADFKKMRLTRPYSKRQRSALLMGYLRSFKRKGKHAFCSYKYSCQGLEITVGVLYQGF